MRRGEVRWFRFKSPDKSRPVLILTRDSALPYLGKVTAAPISSRGRDVPSEVALDERDGMPRSCVVNLDAIFSEPRSRFGAPITQLPRLRMREVGSALMFALGLGVR